MASSTASRWAPIRYAYVYNKALLAKLGIELPDPTTWTNDDFEAIGMQVKDQLPEGMYFGQNMGYWEPRLENWVRQRGKALYTEDGTARLRAAGPRPTSSPTGRTCRTRA